VNGGARCRGQYRKLVGYTSKYPYVVGISAESGDLGSGVLISPKFVLTCAHVLHDYTSVEVLSGE
jgi:V8-like Glu-specific endopeptidase